MLEKVQMLAKERIVTTYFEIVAEKLSQILRPLGIGKEVEYLRENLCLRIEAMRCMHHRTASPEAGCEG